MENTDNKYQKSENRNIFTREEMLQQIKDCGESIIKNAEGILGDEKYFLNTTVMFTINRDRNMLPKIDVRRDFIPEQQIDRIVNENKEEKKDE